MSESEDRVSRLVASAERMHDTVLRLRGWAAGYLPGEIPAPLQRVIDAARDYENSFSEYTEARNADLEG